MSDVYVEVDGTSRPIKNLSATWSIKQRSSAEVTLVDVGLNYVPLIGHKVEIGDSANLLFGGTVDAVEAQWEAGTAYREWRLLVASWEQIAARRRTGVDPYVTAANSQPSYVITQLRDDILAGEGISTISVSSGADSIALPALTFTNETVEAVLDQICTLANAYWDITPSRTLRVFQRTTFPGPWSITETSPHVRRMGRLSVKWDRQKVTNRVFVQIGQYIGDPQSEVVTGDGTQTEFATTLPIGATPTLTRSDSIAAEIGTSGDGATHTWLWQLGTASVRMNTDIAHSPLPTGVTMQIDYLPVSARTILVEDAANISARAARETTSGKYDSLIEANTPSTSTQGQALAEAVLATDKEDAVVVTINTLDTDLRVGQLTTINWPSAGVSSSQFLLETLTLTAGVNQLDNYQATFSRGGLLPSWQESFRGGSVSGSSGGSVVQSSSGSTMYDQEHLLTANATINAAYTATTGAQLVLRIKQNASTPYTAGLGTGFKVGIGFEITPTLDAWSVLSFVGGPDGTWWPSSMPFTELPN